MNRRGPNYDSLRTLMRSVAAPAGAALAAAGVLLAGCGSSGGTAEPEVIVVNASGSALDQLLNSPGAAVVKPGEARLTGVADPRSVPKVVKKELKDAHSRGFQSKNGVKIPVGQVVRVDAHVHVDQASSDDDFFDETEKLNDGFSCNTHQLEKVNPNYGRVVALALDKDTSDIAMVIWQRQPNGETSPFISVCSAEDNEPSDGVALAYVEVDPANTFDPAPLTTVSVPNQCFKTLYC